MSVVDVETESLKLNYFSKQLVMILIKLYNNIHFTKKKTKIILKIKRSIYLKCVAFPEQDPPFKHSDGLHGSDSNWQFFPVYPAIKV